MEISNQKGAASSGNFVLTVEGDRLSLEAQEASLRAILEEIGRKMHLEVLGEVPAQETVTAAFHDLPLEQALHRLSSNFGYQMKSEEGGQAISKIFILPKGTGPANAKRDTREVAPREEIVTSNSDPVIQAGRAKGNEADQLKPTRPEPFKFQFDPSEFANK